MTRRRRILATLGYIAFLLVCAEVTLQLFYRATAGSFLFTRAVVPVWAPNEWSGVFNKPNLSHHHHTSEFEATNFTNSQGLRVPEGGGDYTSQPPPDTTRILLLGPSFAFGWGVDYEATFGHLLERRLEAEGYGSRRRVQLINAGVNSLGPAPQLNWFRHVGREFHPALVIQLVYGSMAIETDPRPKSATPDGYLIRKDASAREQLVERAKTSALVFYAWILYTRLDQAVSGADAGRVIGAGRELQLRRDFSPGDPAVQDSMSLYRELRDEIRSAGAEPLVVFLPLSYVVHPEDISRWRHQGVRDVAAQREFDAAFCRYLSTRESLPCLDVTDGLTRAASASPERLYYWLDVHWTEAGNRVAAEAAAAYLLDARS